MKMDFEKQNLLNDRITVSTGTRVEYWYLAMRWLGELSIFMELTGVPVMKQGVSVLKIKYQN